MATPANTDNVILAVKEIVADHYSHNEWPLLLASLGKALRQRGVWEECATDRRKLTDVIEAAADPDLVIIRDKNSPAYVVVVNKESEEKVREFIRQRNRTDTRIPDLAALPRSVLLAFCVKQPEGKSVHLQRTPPFKYVIDLPEAEMQEQYWSIDDRYRRPGLKLMDISQIAPSDRSDLQTRIAAWSRDNDVDLQQLYKAVPGQHQNALQRLLAAQLPGVAEKMLIPGDIALILSQKE